MMDQKWKFYIQLNVVPLEMNMLSMDRFVWCRYNCLDYVCMWLLWCAIPYFVMFAHLQKSLTWEHDNRFHHPNSPMCQCVMYNFVYRMAIDRILLDIWPNVNMVGCMKPFPTLWSHNGQFYKIHFQPHLHHCKWKKKKYYDENHMICLSNGFICKIIPVV